MTGYGSGTASNDSASVTAEIRSVNNRFYEFSVRLPKFLQSRELELKELVRTRVKRGKVNLAVTMDRTGHEASPVQINMDAARTYHALLMQLQQALGLTGEITLEMLLKFSDVFAVDELDKLSDVEWELVIQAVNDAVASMLDMKAKEGAELSADLAMRSEIMRKGIDAVERLATGRADLERARLVERLQNLISDDKIDPDRLELEIVMLADKMDITEELVRFRSHTKFFLENLESDESEGRKLSFLLQEMNREANTISSKSYDAEIAHIVVSIKEELERIREQIQNIE